MAESTSSLVYETYRIEIAHYLGYGRTAASWSDAQRAAITSCLNSGLRQFYVQGAWEWSFMREIATMVLWADVVVDSAVTLSGGSYADPVTTLTASAATFYPEMVGRSIVITGVDTFVIVAYTSTTEIDVTGDASGASSATFSIASAGLYRLPDDCQDVEGAITFAAETGERTMIQKPEEWMRGKRQWEGSTTGPPLYWAMIPAAFAEATGQRWDLSMWPTSDDNYTVTYRKLVNPDVLAAAQFVRGGMAHTETILESCLAIAEARYDDNQGIHKGLYEEKLQESISVDARVAPETLGMNLDRTTGRSRRSDGTYGDCGLYRVSYEGQFGG